MKADSPVRSLINRLPVFVAPDATLADAAVVLQEELVGAVLVAGPRRPEGYMAAGIISERDITRAVAEGINPRSARVEDLMTGDVATIEPDSPLSAAAALMLEYEIRHLPVVVDGIAVGVISERDVLRACLALVV